MSAGQGRLRGAHADDYVTDLFAANKEKNNLIPNLEFRTIYTTGVLETAIVHKDSSARRQNTVGAVRLGLVTLMSLVFRLAGAYTVPAYYRACSRRYLTCTLHVGSIPNGADSRYNSTVDSCVLLSLHGTLHIMV